MFNFFHFIQTMLCEIREQRHREREIMAIARLDDHLLHDIGLTRGDVDRMIIETLGAKPLQRLERGITLPKGIPSLTTPAGYSLQH